MTHQLPDYVSSYRVISFKYQEFVFTFANIFQTGESLYEWILTFLFLSVLLLPDLQSAVRG
jgi:hypothetical protein